jgi:UDPglucose--hexose-1-phosphate uridylyltransferase
MSGVSELRRDPFTRSWVVIAPDRAHRPQRSAVAAVSRQPPSRWDRDCPFCPGHDADTPGELWRQPDPGDPTGWSVRVVPNRYPVLAGAPGGQRRSDGPYFSALAGTGAHEVVIESPRHDWDLADAGPRGVLDVVAAYRARARALRGRHPGLVLPFRNSGAAAGTSLPHPHSQIVATPIVPLRLRQLFDVARAHYDDAGSCLYTDVVAAELADGSRVVLETPRLAAFVPYAARASSETWIAPRQHAAAFADVDDALLHQFADTLAAVLRALRRAAGDILYNYVLYSAPAGEESAPYFVWHLQLVPRLSTPAGFELGTGIAVNPVLPEHAAEQLRHALPPAPGRQPAPGRP